MDFELSDEQRLLRDTVRDFARGEVAPRAAEQDRTKSFPYELVAAMGELGLMGIPFPAEYGGGGADSLSYALAVEELARVDSSTAITLAAHTSLGTMPIYLWGSDEQRADWLPSLCSGQRLAAFGLTEPEAGSDPGGMTTRAEPVAGGYRLSGLTRVGEDLRIGKLLDRGWPDYSYPAPVDDPATKNYRAFIKWQTEKNGLAVERFTPGRQDQVVLRRDPRKYPNFEFRNVGANGEIWTGVGTATRQYFPALENVPRADWPSENMCSISFRMSYGAFDFFNGGDIPGIPSEGFPSWHDVETPVAKAVGPVEAAILDHHGYIDTQNEFFVATLRPRVWLLSVWDSGHPTLRVWNRLRSQRLYPGPREVFATDLHPATRLTVGGIDQLASDRGHIVVRVSPGGGEYRVVIVDDSSESHRVKKVFGPYTSR